MIPEHSFDYLDPGSVSTLSMLLLNFLQKEMRRFSKLQLSEIYHKDRILHTNSNVGIIINNQAFDTEIEYNTEHLYYFSLSDQQPPINFWEQIAETSNDTYLCYLGFPISSKNNNLDKYLSLIGSKMIITGAWLFDVDNDILPEYAVIKI